MPTNLPVPPPADPIPHSEPLPRPDVVPPDDPAHDRSKGDPHIDPPPILPPIDDPASGNPDPRLAL
jgi:hypothetical protein